jgi:hypothetical protein
MRALGGCVIFRFMGGGWMGRFRRGRVIEGRLQRSLSFFAGSFLRIFFTAL